MTELDRTLAPEVAAIIAEFGVDLPVTARAPVVHGRVIGPKPESRLVRMTPPLPEKSLGPDGIVKTETVMYTAAVVAEGESVETPEGPMNVKGVSAYYTGELVAARRLVMGR